jgi:hypothetical protein
LSKQRLLGDGLLMRTCAQRLLALVPLVAGCGGSGDSSTGILLAIDGPNVTRLEFHLARSACGTWTQDGSVQPVSADVTGRDLAANPYKLLVTPSMTGDFGTIIADVVGWNGDTPAATGYFVLPPFQQGRVIRVDHTLDDPASTDWHDQQGCFCHDGLPWLGVAGMACGGVPSVAPLDPAQMCPAIQAALVAACDGQSSIGESTGRALPCFSTVNGVCLAGTRTCADHDGVAYVAACQPDPTMKVTSNWCDRYASGEQTTCSDPLDTVIAGAKEVSVIVCTGELTKHTAFAALPRGFDAPPHSDVVYFGPDPSQRATVAFADGNGDVTLHFGPNLPPPGAVLTFPLLVADGVAILHVTLAGTCPPMGDMATGDLAGPIDAGVQDGSGGTGDASVSDGGIVVVDGGMPVSDGITVKNDGPISSGDLRVAPPDLRAVDSGTSPPGDG